MIKAGSPEGMDRMMARLDADKNRPMDDTSPIRDFPKYGRPSSRLATSTARPWPGRAATG
ncbi:hypothetical protein ACSBOX_06020 [Arthrobacter sp. KN11-1C]|uniref:hypothetical protein n=1 Tax=Arthrobacter sp. KN11-1C TaxID=3445774 RepID=UPI003F9F07D5